MGDYWSAMIRQHHDFETVRKFKGCDARFVRGKCSSARRAEQEKHEH
jgi:hypothetical protein